MKQIIIFFILLSIHTITAQNKDANFYKVHIESGEGKNTKSCEGHYLTTELTKNKVPYSAIVTNKTILVNATEIRIYLNTNEKGKSFMVTLPIKSIQIIQYPNNDIIIIPFGQIHQMVANKQIMDYQFFLDEGDLLAAAPEIKPTDFSKIKKFWEWEVTEAYKRKVN